jgi:ubiquinone/menaquinone biosynthesis C-methylase UbiE
MNSDYEKWNRIYRNHSVEALPWELGKPRKVLVDLIEKGQIKKGKTLDTCCGAGTNTLYLAKKGFQVTGIDISSKAIEYSKEKARKTNIKVRFQIQNFLNLQFKDEELNFAFDMGCFHHVLVKDRSTYIKGVNRVFKTGGSYLMVCFSCRNDPAWNHFTEEQIIQLFSNYFKIKNIEHIASVEGDGYVRYFYAVLMEKKQVQRFLRLS